MAATMRGMCFSRSVQRFLPKKQLVGNLSVQLRCLCSSGGSQNNTDKPPTTSTARDPGPLFIDTRVQEILHRVSGFNLDKIFRERLTKAVPPNYKLLTDKELHDYQEDAIRRGYERLQIPPVLKARDNEKFEVLSDDPEIEGYDSTNYVFTDISFGIADKSRTIVIREPSGKLRTATPPERDHVLQVYTPREGKISKTPSMLLEENMEALLQEGLYEYILDRACVQFEPDDSEFIRITQRTYEHINSHGQFDLLRSTRHFGGMTFYLAFNKKIDHLITDMIQRDLISDAGDTVHLYNILHPDCASAQEAKQQNIHDPLELIMLFANKDAVHPGMIELAIQTHRETKESKKAGIQTS